MKIIDKYILKTFVITFTTVFVILFFIFILQSVWLFISELAGKDLDFFMVSKFLMFSMPRIVPLVLPLSILLASIMTFGSLAENYEFAAMKSSGISLQRCLKTLSMFIVLLSILAFIFANNVIPYAEYEFTSFRMHLAQKKPALAITEGQFSEIGNYSIKVNKKTGENGNFLTDVTIHKKSNLGNGINTVIKAKTGELISNDKSNILKLILNEGYYYEDIVPKKFEEQSKLPFAKAFFKKDIINIDLSMLNNMGSENEKMVSTNVMLNINELRYTIDSLNVSYKKDVLSFADNIYQRTGVSNANRAIPFENTSTINTNVLDNYGDLEQNQILQIASSNIGSTLFAISNAKEEMNTKLKNINNHWLALYDKLVIAYACILMFFIGAPLGAIIRKGGLGLPIVFAVLIFIIFHFTNTFGRRFAQENGIAPIVGSWLSSFLLTPLAIILTYKATNDLGSISFAGVFKPFANLFAKKSN